MGICWRLERKPNSQYKCWRPQCAAELLLIFWLRYAAGSSGKLNQVFLRLFSLHLQHPVVFFVCSPCLLTLWQLESSWIVWEEWVFVLPTCCHCGFDCLSRQHGLRHNHSHTVTPVDGHSFWQGSQMALQVLCGLQPSEGVIDCVSGRLSNITAEREVWRAFTAFLLLSCWEIKLLGESMNRSLSLQEHV